MSKVQVGIIGCGNISEVYMNNIQNMFSNIALAACADLDIKRAQTKVEQLDDQGNLKYHNVSAMTVSDLLADNKVQIVVNLTPPQAHFSIAMEAIQAGKHVYNEKPLTLSLEQGRQLITAAQEKGVLLGCAPDTFMGAGLQTCRKLIDDGWIGTPTSGTAFFCTSGPESWHPDPGFFYLPGGGPLFDVGPYSLTTLVNLLGPVQTVAGMTGKATKERICTCQARFGEALPVEVPTHVAGILRFASGAIVTLISSFDIIGHHLPNIEIHGTLGSLRGPDPNGFDGPVEYKRRGSDEWKEVPLTHPYTGQCRGLGVADMAKAICHHTTHKANANLAYHVLEIMHALHESSERQTFIDISSTVSRPEALESSLLQGNI